jgi:hypothetical protein
MIQDVHPGSVTQFLIFNPSWIPGSKRHRIRNTASFPKAITARRFIQYLYPVIHGFGGVWEMGGGGGDGYRYTHRLTMELDLQSLFGLHVYTAIIIG